MKLKKLSVIFLSLILSITIILSFTACSISTDLLGTENSAQQTFYINENGHLIMTNPNGEVIDLGKVKGEDGSSVEKGDKGEKGEKGDSGDVAIENASTSALRSTVSILCTYTYQQASFFRGTVNTYEGAQQGSGVIYQDDKENGDAYIITNYHVVYGNYISDIVSNIYVYLYGSETQLYYSSNTSLTTQAEEDGKAIKAEYIGGTMTYDIAVLKISNSTVYKNSASCPVTLANSDTALAGDPVVVVGNAEGYGLSVTSGVVSKESEYITMYAADNKSIVTFRSMRTDAAINSGNSGGGMYDKSGRLIAVVNLGSSSAENMADGIPVSIAKRCADLIIDVNSKTSGINIPYIGISYAINDCYSLYDAETKRISTVEIVSVDQVEANGTADGVLKSGDIINSISINNGETMNITKRYQLYDAIISMKIGDKLTFNITRNGVDKTVTLTLNKTKSVA